MRFTKNIGLYILLLLLPNLLIAQADILEDMKKPIFKRPAVQLRVRAQKDKILLRWAVDQPYAWKISSPLGFVIQRFTVMRDSQMLKKPEIRKLTADPVKPKNKEAWLSVFDKNPQAAIIAQCLFGESIQMQGNPNTLMKQKEELEQRFTFALMAADQNFEAATLAGWAYTDTDVKPNEKYLYRVYSVVPTTQMVIDTALALVGLSDSFLLPKPLEVIASFGNKKVNLSWDYKTLSNYYNNYFIEKSEDSTNFSKATNLPVTMMNTPEGEKLGRMYFTDSLLENDKKYFYRIRGISCFGEIGQPSDIVWGTGRDRMLFSPNIIDYKILNDSVVDLTWTLVEDSTNYLLEYFELSRSNESEKGYKIVRTQIAKTDRKIQFKGLESSNYFTIAAVDKYGEKYFSFPQLVQPIDSTPPSVPIGLEGIVNDSGIVSLKWIPNKEKDIYGYHIYKGNVSDEEFALITTSPLRDTVFVDSVDMKMLNKNVYYKIAALDLRFNQSPPSKAVTVEKPDQIPPVTPQFTDFKLEEGKVTLFWENSSSEDVMLHRIYRLDPTLVQWKLTKEFKGKDSTTFIDYDVAAGKQFAYTLVAVDKSKNESPPSQPLAVTAPLDKRNHPSIKDLRALVDRKAEKVLIDWNYDEKGVVEFQIYRAFGNEPISLWQVLEASTRGIVDEKLIINNIYRYAVRAVFADGSMSTWKEIKINY